MLGAKKGLVTGRGLPNEAMAARYVLKDYVNGKLLFCHVRPDYDLAAHGEIQQSGFKKEEEEEEIEGNNNVPRGEERRESEHQTEQDNNNIDEEEEEEEKQEENEDD